jgi:hypothetical protein
MSFFPTINGLIEDFSPFNFRSDPSQEEGEGSYGENLENNRLHLLVW